MRSFVVGVVVGVVLIFALAVLVLPVVLTALFGWWWLLLLAVSVPLVMGGIGMVLEW